MCLNKNNFEKEI